MERNGQRVVADMRGTLEKLAQRIESLKKAKERSYRGVGWAIFFVMKKVNYCSWSSEKGWWEIMSNKNIINMYVFKKKYVYIYTIDYSVQSSWVL